VARGATAQSLVLPPSHSVSDVLERTHLSVSWRSEKRGYLITGEGQARINNDSYYYVNMHIGMGI